MKIFCQYEELLDPKSLNVHPKNRNKHSKDQIKRLAQLYTEHGIRHPIIVSSLSGFIVAGHGRRAAAIEAGIKEFPVVVQDFESEEKEYAFLISDNAIAEWAELDIKGITLDIGDFSSFNIDSLGIKDFTLDFGPKPFAPNMDEKSVDDKVEKGVTKMIHECPKCKHRFT